MRRREEKRGRRESERERERETRKRERKRGGRGRARRVYSLISSCYRIAWSSYSVRSLAINSMAAPRANGRRPLLLPSIYQHEDCTERVLQQTNPKWGGRRRHIILGVSHHWWRTITTVCKYRIATMGRDTKSMALLRPILFVVIGWIIPPLLSSTEQI